ncbi:hypothetical protein BTXL6_03680 [Bacillus thuringiensis]|nr:hypothetical protein BTXL6_03680 [Bacillus thuringiensis]KXO05457.1 hypothetical protein AYK81_18480 [Bacillus thuringiensis]
MKYQKVVKIIKQVSEKKTVMRRKAISFLLMTEVFIHIKMKIKKRLQKVVFNALLETASFLF